MLGASRRRQRHARDHQPRRLEPRDTLSRLLKLTTSNDAPASKTSDSEFGDDQPGASRFAVTLPVPPRDSSFNDTRAVHPMPQRRQHAEQRAGRQRHPPPTPSGRGHRCRDDRRRPRSRKQYEGPTSSRPRGVIAGSAGGRDHQAFGEHLLHEPVSRRADSGPDRDSSFCRAARASRSVATFAQAISSTKPTAPSITSSMVRTSPTASMRSGRVGRDSRSRRVFLRSLIPMIEALACALAGIPSPSRLIASECAPQRAVATSASVP